MPTYEYECTNKGCSLKFSKIKKFKESADPDTCPKCGAKAKRILSAGIFDLRGEGFFREGLN